MEKRMHAAVEAKREEILAFVRELVSIRSVTGQEAPVAAAVEKKLRELGFDDVQTDRTGNVIGSVGTGATTILFDGHMDTVDVIDVMKPVYNFKADDETKPWTKKAAKKDEEADDASE